MVRHRPRAVQRPRPRRRPGVGGQGAQLGPGHAALLERRARRRPPAGHLSRGRPPLPADRAGRQDERQRRARRAGAGPRRRVPGHGRGRPRGERHRPAGRRRQPRHRLPGLEPALPRHRHPGRRRDQAGVRDAQPLDPRVLPGVDDAQRTHDDARRRRAPLPVRAPPLQRAGDCHQPVQQRQRPQVGQPDVQEPAPRAGRLVGRGAGGAERPAVGLRVAERRRAQHGGAGLGRRRAARHLGVLHDGHPGSARPAPPAPERDGRGPQPAGSLRRGRLHVHDGRPGGGCALLRRRAEARALAPAVARGAQAGRGCVRQRADGTHQRPLRRGRRVPAGRGGPLHHPRRRPRARRRGHQRARHRLRTRTGRSAGHLPVLGLSRHRRLEDRLPVHPRCRRQRAAAGAERGGPVRCARIDVPARVRQEPQGHVPLRALRARGGPAEVGGTGRRGLPRAADQYGRRGLPGRGLHGDARRLRRCRRDARGDAVHAGVHDDARDGARLRAAPRRRRVGAQLQARLLQHDELPVSVARAAGRRRRAAPGLLARGLHRHRDQRAIAFRRIAEPPALPHRLVRAAGDELPERHRDARRQALQRIAAPPDGRPNGPHRRAHGRGAHRLEGGRHAGVHAVPAGRQLQRPDDHAGGHAGDSRRLERLGTPCPQPGRREAQCRRAVPGPVQSSRRGPALARCGARGSGPRRPRARGPGARRPRTWRPRPRRPGTWRSRTRRPGHRPRTRGSRARRPGRRGPLRRQPE